MTQPSSQASDLEAVDWPWVASGPTNEGRVDVIVLRLANEARERPEEALLTVDEGLVGDRWSRADDAEMTSQLTLLNSGVARIIAGGESRLEEFGDNFLVDFDIGAANLPIGARLRLGEAELEVTSEPHLGCAKFARRFGHEALRIVNRKELLHLKLRGIHARVLKPGRVYLGAPIAKLASD